MVGELYSPYTILMAIWSLQLVRGDTMLTTEQNEKFIQAIGDGHQYPEYTDDPEVNDQIDAYVSGHLISLAKSIRSSPND